MIGVPVCCQNRDTRARIPDSRSRGQILRHARGITTVSIPHARVSSIPYHLITLIVYNTVKVQNSAPLLAFCPHSARFSLNLLQYPQFHSLLVVFRSYRVRAGAIWRAGRVVLLAVRRAYVTPGGPGLSLRVILCYNDTVPP